MKLENPENPLIIFLQLLVETDYLLALVPEIEVSKVPRYNKKKQGVSRAIIVNLSACLESYFTNVIMAAIETIAFRAQNADSIPMKLRLKISRKLTASKDERAIWCIADQGWRNKLVENAEALTNKFNSARPTTVDQLFEDTIGLVDISKKWKWPRSSAEKNCRFLNSFMDLRGEIAHKLKTKENITHEKLHNYRAFLNKLANITNNIVREYIFETCGHYPWAEEAI